MWETWAKIRTVNIQLFLTRDVNVLATGAVDFHATCWQFLTNADGEHVLSLTHDSGARAEAAEHEFFFHHGEASWGEDKASVDQPIQVHRRLVDLEEILIV